jgi:hypothetical protein
VNDQWTTLAARPQVILDVVVGGHGTGTALERDRQHAGGLVEDDERGVLIEDQRMAWHRTRLPGGAAGTIHPQLQPITGTEAT